MKLSLLSIIILLFVSTTENNLPSEDNVNPILAKYYKLINVAELLIVDSLYEEAFTMYNSAFEINKKPLCTDIYNYAILCQELGKNEIANEKMTYLDDLIIVKKGKRKDSSLLTEDHIFLLDMLKEDQMDRLESAKKTDFIYQGASGDYLRERDSIRYIKFLDRYGENGYPREEISGVFGLDGNSRILDVVMSHWQSNKFPLDSIVLKSLHKGAIYVEDAVFLIDDGTKYGQALAYSMNGDTTNSYLGINLEKMRYFDQNRALIYLESYSDYIKKYEFQLTPRGRKFRLIRMQYALLRFN
jgi:hypothetical protein